MLIQEGIVKPKVWKVFCDLQIVSPRNRKTTVIILPWLQKRLKCSIMQCRSLCQLDRGLILIKANFKHRLPYTLPTSSENLLSVNMVIFLGIFLCKILLLLLIKCLGESAQILGHIQLVKSV